MSIAKRNLDHDTWMNDHNARAAAFNPTPTSEGWDLFEHWQIGQDGRPWLMLVTSSPYDVGALDPGDFILRRRWAPAGSPEVVNHARPEAASDV